MLKIIETDIEATIAAHNIDEIEHAILVTYDNESGRLLDIYIKGFDGAVYQADSSMKIIPTNLKGFNNLYKQFKSVWPVQFYLVKDWSDIKTKIMINKDN